MYTLLINLIVLSGVTFDSVRGQRVACLETPCPGINMTHESKTHCSAYDRPRTKHATEILNVTILYLYSTTPCNDTGNPPNYGIIGISVWTQYYCGALFEVCAVFPSTITEPPVLTTHTSPSIQKSYSVITFSGRSPNQTESTSQPSLLSTFSQYTTAVTSEGVYTSTETTEPPPTTNSTSAITLNTRSTVVQHDDWIFDKLITIPWGVAGGLIFLVANGGILSRFVGRTACNRVSP